MTTSEEEMSDHTRREEERLELQRFTARRSVRSIATKLDLDQAEEAAWYVQSTLELCGLSLPQWPGIPPGTALGSDRCWGMWLYHQGNIKHGLEQMDHDEIMKVYDFLQLLCAGLVRARQPRAAGHPEVLLSGLWDGMSASQWDTLVDHCHQTLDAIVFDPILEGLRQWRRQRQRQRQRMVQMRWRLLLHGPKFCKAVETFHARALADTQVAQRRENKKKYRVLQHAILQRLRHGVLWFEPSRFRRRSEHRGYLPLEPRSPGVQGSAESSYRAPGAPAAKAIRQMGH